MLKMLYWPALRTGPTDKATDESKTDAPGPARRPKLGAGGSKPQALFSAFSILLFFHRHGFHILRKNVLRVTAAIRAANFCRIFLAEAS